MIKVDPDWKSPNISLLNHKQDKADAGDVQANAEIIRETLSNFNIDVEMEGANIGTKSYPIHPQATIRNKVVQNHPHWKATSPSI